MSDYSDYFTGLRARKSYDPATALSLAVACELAYKAKPVIEKTVVGWGFPGFAFVNVKKGHDIDTQGFVMANEKDVVVVFRGSDKINDWFANFQAVRDPGPLVKTKAHEGFQDALFPAVVGLAHAIDRLRTGQQRVWFTGHSLGGALCSLCAGMMVENNYPVYGIYTFASPRPGDDDFAKALSKAVPGPHHRVVNEGDIVPHLPPEPFFSHPGKRMILKKRGHETSKSAWTKLRKKIFSKLMDLTGRPWDIADNHVLDDPDSGYIVRLIDQVARR